MKTAFLCVAFLVFLVGCKDLDDHYQYKRGQMVVSVLNGQKGQVIDVSPGGRKILVRFTVRQQTTKTHILGDDEPIEDAPFASILMHYFEIRPFSERTAK